MTHLPFETRNWFSSAICHLLQTPTQFFPIDANPSLLTTYYILDKRQRQTTNDNDNINIAITHHSPTMKFLLTTFLTALATAVVAADKVPHTLDASLEHQFMDWMKTHHKIYENTKDMLRNMEVWMDNHGK
jgi:hypothetical protein